MSQIKQSFILDIKVALRESVFTLDDFEISFPDSGNTLIKIKFIHRPTYSCSVYETIEVEEVTTSNSRFAAMSMMGNTIEKTKVHVTYIEARPGEYKTIDKTKITDLSEILSFIPDWCKYIKSDLYAMTPKVDPLEEIRKKFSYDFDEMIDEPDSYFDSEEVNNIKDIFESLYKEIEELKEQWELTDQQLRSVKDEFEEFKTSATSYPKGMWARITNNKIVEIAEKLITSKEGRQLIFDGLKKFLSG